MYFVKHLSCIRGYSEDYSKNYIYICYITSTLNNK